MAWHVTPAMLEKRKASARAKLAKLTPDQVRAVRRRRAEGAAMSHIAAEFRVSFGCIQAICNRTTWKDVIDEE